MINTRRFFTSAATSAAILGGLVAHAAASDPGPYSRVSESKTGDVTLEMCERVFVPVDGNGPRVHLVSAIHIADQSFYQAMQELLESYDSVLFEGVKPAGLDAIDPDLDDQAKADATAARLELLVDIATGFYHEHGRFPNNVSDLIEHSDPRIAAVIESIRNDGWGNPIGSGSIQEATLGKLTKKTITFNSLGADSKRGGDGLDADITSESESFLPTDKRKKQPVGIQSQMASALHVAFQLDEMDMSGKGWINADIDINTLQDQLAEMGEDNAMILSLLEGNSFQAKLMGFVLKFVERSPTMSSMMKLALMDMLTLMETTDMMAQFDAIEEVILNGRNDIVIEYLREELKDHQEYDSIAIFYGAAHMPGIEEVLVEEMGYQFEYNSWAPAMTVNIKDTGMSAGQVKFMRNMIKTSLEEQF